MKKQLKVIMAGTTVFWGASIFNDPVQAIVLEKVPTTQTSSEKENTAGIFGILAMVLGFFGLADRKKKKDE